MSCDSISSFLSKQKRKQNTTKRSRKLQKQTLSAHAMTEKPLTNLKFCSTGIAANVRSDIAAKIKSMGGLHVSNLMSDVNYLIVGDNNKATEKYQFCIRKRADIRFVDVDYILNLHANWINNKEITLDYSFPLFKDLNICLSRINNDQHVKNVTKEDLVKLITENGGTVTDALSKSNNCLITNEKSGKRFDVAVQWNLPIIHPIYVLHSIKRTAPLELQYYEISNIDIEEIGKGSCEVWGQLDKKRKKRVIKDEDDDQEEKDLIIKKKNPKIWTSIMNDQKLLVKNAKVKTDHQWDEQVEEGEFNIPKVSIDLSKSNLFITRPHSTIFQNKIFKIEHFSSSQSDTLKKVILSHSGSISEDDDDTYDYIIIPSATKIDTLPSKLQDTIKNQSLYSTKILTEWFVERSLHYKTFKVDQWGLPFNRTIVPSRDKILPSLKICVSGFQGIELLHLIKLIEMIPNFEKFDNLNDEKDVLVVNIDLFKSKKNSGSLISKYTSLFQTEGESEINSISLKSTNNKMNFAKENFIPIISISFLFEIFLNSEDLLININNKNWCLHCPKPENLNDNLKKLLLRSERDELLEKRRREKEKEALQSRIAKTEKLKSKPIKASKSSSKSASITTSAREPSALESQTIPDSLDSASSIPKIPSPIRNKRNNIGRIVGRASVSQFNINKDLDLISQPDHQPNDQDEDFRMTQIGYEDESEELLRIMNGGKKVTEKEINRKRTTRSGYKEIMNIDIE